MKIAVDATLLTGRFSGVEKAILGLVQNLVAAAQDDTVLIYVSRNFDKNLLQRGVKLRRSWFRNRFKILRIGWNQTMLPLAVRMERADVFHAPGYVAPLWQPVPTVLTVYDCIALTHPKMCRWANRRHYQLMVPASVRRSARVIVPTETVKSELLKATGVDEDKIRVIPLGVSPQYTMLSEDELEEVRERYDLPDRFILFVGTLEPKKNIEMLLKAFFALKLDTKLPHKLVLAGKRGPAARSITRTIGLHQLEDDIKLLGYFPEEDMCALYGLADLLAFPSVVEGFGFPPLEAMACGTPVIASNIPTLAEVLGDAAHLVEPGSIRETKESMEELLSDRGLSRRYREAGLARAGDFSWARTIRQTIELYREVVREHRGGR